MRSIVSDLDTASGAELVAAAGAIAAELASRPAPEPGPCAMELAESLGRAIDVAEAALAILVRRVDVTGAYEQQGAGSATAWLRTRLGMRHGRAAERVTLAQQLPRLDRVSKLLAAGELSYGFAATIGGAVPQLSDGDAQAAQDILLGMVEQGCTTQQVGKAGARITDLIAERHGGQGEPADSRRGFARSWLSRSRSLDGGSWMKAWLTPEHTAIFDQVVGALAKPKARWDDRDIAQRTADALMSVISEGNRGAGVTVIIDLTAYAAATGDPAPFAAAGHAAPFHYGPRGETARQNGFGDTPEPAGRDKSGSGPGRGSVPGSSLRHAERTPAAAEAQAGTAPEADPRSGAAPGLVRT